MNRRILFGIFLLSLVLRLGAFGFLVNRFGVEGGLFWADSTQYTTLAKNMLAGHGFTLETAPPFAPDTLRTPGYPAYVAILFKISGNLWFPALVQTIFNSLIPILAMMIAWRIWKRPSVAYVTGLLIALEPQLIIYSLALGSEGTFIILSCLFVLQFMRYLERGRLTNLVWSGLLFSVSAITRPVFAYFLPIAFVFVAWRVFRTKPLRTASAHAALFLIVSSALLVPWMERNARLTNQFTLSTIGWVNVYTRLAATVEAIANKQDFETSYRQSLIRLADEGIIQEPKEHELYNAKYIPLLRERSIAIFKAHPKELFLLQLTSLNTIVSGDNVFQILRQTDLVPPPVRPPIPPSLSILQQGPIKTAKEVFPYLRGSYLIPYVMHLVWYAVFFLALFGTYALFNASDRRQRMHIALLWSLILFYIVMTLPIASSIDARYRLVFEPFSFIFTAAGLVAIARKCSRKKPFMQSEEPRAICLLCEGEGFLAYPASTKAEAPSSSYQITESGFGAHYTIFTCAECGSAFQPFPGGNEALQRLYASQPLDTVYLSEEAGRRKSFEDIVKRIEALVPPGSILDIGGGPGLFLAVAKERGWKTSGVELSEASVAAARARFDVEMVQGDLSKVADFPAHAFDVVTAFDVAEHLENPNRLFIEAKRLLKPHGLFVWTTPKYNSWIRRILGRGWYSILPFHLVYFTDESIAHVAATHGFRVRQREHYKRYFSLRYFLYRLSTLLPKKWAEKIQNMPGLERPIPLQLYDEFELYFETV